MNETAFPSSLQSQPSACLLMTERATLHSSEDSKSVQIRTHRKGRICCTLPAHWLMWLVNVYRATLAPTWKFQEPAVTSNTRGAAQSPKSCTGMAFSLWESPWHSNDDPGKSSNHFPSGHVMLPLHFLVLVRWHWNQWSLKLTPPQHASPCRSLPWITEIALYGNRDFSCHFYRLGGPISLFFLSFLRQALTM